ncbi:hypothetical protein CPT_Pollock39 [Escherichia phage Pollock]|uniref:Uncharacterized protein n=1 Tax=Escherichia phage Pollock TaxID=1540097 RepID=A0A0A0YU65_9CAUD|nr:hypothetical protein ACQ44_gp39 [Escherichia phage Pollock]AIX12398.1 hypothetical protein CPT_Pollock39 [Escherichia phage Pollock]
MNIQKFGEITFIGKSNLPAMTNFVFEVENKAESEMIENHQVKTLLMLTAVRNHFDSVISMVQNKLDKASISDFEDFSVPVGKSDKSPKEIVLESLSRIMNK